MKAISSLAILLIAIFSAAGSPAPQFKIQRISRHVSVVLGPVNGVLIQRGGKTLAIYGDPQQNPPKADKVLFTDHRRDVVWAGRRLVDHGAEAVVPASEKPLFTDVRQFWERYETARFHDYAAQSSKVMTEPFSRVTTVRGGDHVNWEGLQIRVLDTPGYTRGAVSYLFEVDGKRIACVGELIYGDGQLFDLYSLQDAIPAAKEDAYHGYGARAADVLTSLRKVDDWTPDILIPSRGPVIQHPEKAIRTLTQRVQAVFGAHFAIDALPWYRGKEKMAIQETRILGSADVIPMPLATTLQPKPPDWIIPIDNSRLIVSRSGAAFLVDCGSARILQQVQKLRDQGVFRTLEGIYVTHYHDDHTDHVQAAADTFHCPVYACPEMRDILEHPMAYRMPAETPNPIHVSVVPDGTRRRWHEFEFTYSWFPGQTLYHGGLLVKKDGGETIFFIGDSFTPTGIDNYCLLNRNFLPPEPGFLQCLNVLKEMKPDYLLINEHVLPAFRYSAQQIDFMIDNLREQTHLLQKLFPWDDPNYGVDEQWARLYPYGVNARPGQQIELKAVIRNHSSSRQEFRITPHVPKGWKGPANTIQLSVSPHEEQTASIPLTVPSNTQGLHIVTADVAFGPWDLRQWAEAMIDVQTR